MRVSGLAERAGFLAKSLDEASKLGVWSLWGNRQLCGLAFGVGIPV